MGQLEQRKDAEKDAELAKLRGELEEFAQGKESELQEVRDAAAAMQQQHQQCANENRILKRAVAIQDGKLREGASELLQAHSHIEQMQEELRQAQQLTYAMAARLREVDDGSGGGGGGDGGVGGFGYDANTDVY